MSILTSRTPPHLITLVLISGMSALSMNVFLPSLPGMAAHFGVDYAIMQISVSGYLAVSAFVQLLCGPVSDKLGRRAVMMWSLWIFMAATVVTILAPTHGIFLAARLVQSVVAVGLVISRAAVRDLFPGDKAASMIGYVTMGMALVPMIAPVLGGFLDEHFGWRANFSLLLICGALTLGLVWADMGETTQGGGVPFRQQLRTYPILLSSQRFWGYALTAGFSVGQFFAYLGGAAFVGSQVFQLSSSEVGYFFALPAVGYAIGNFVSGRYAVRMGMDRMILIGSLVSAATIAVLLMTELGGLRSPVLFFGLMGVTCMGCGMALPSANTGMMSVRPELAGTASGLGATIMVGGGAALSALAGAALVPGSGPAPLVWIMLLSAFGGLASILWVLRRKAVLSVA